MEFRQRDKQLRFMVFILVISRPVARGQPGGILCGEAGLGLRLGRVRLDTQRLIGCQQLHQEGQLRQVWSQLARRVLGDSLGQVTRQPRPRTGRASEDSAGAARVRTKPRFCLAFWRRRRTPHDPRKEFSGAPLERVDIALQ